MSGKSFKGIKKELASEYGSQFERVTPTIQFSNQLMVAFKKIYELKSVLPVKLIDSANANLKQKIAV